MFFVAKIWGFTAAKGVRRNYKINMQEAKDRLY